MDSLRSLILRPLANPIKAPEPKSNSGPPASANQNQMEELKSNFERLNPDEVSEKHDVKPEKKILNPKISKSAVKVHNQIKSKRFKRDDYKKAKLLWIGYPVDLIKTAQKMGETLHHNKRYSIQVKFLDESGRKRIKNVLFGNVNENDWIHTKDDVARLRCVARLQNCDNFLHENFYRLFILNNGVHDDIMKATDVVKTNLSC